MTCSNKHSNLFKQYLFLQILFSKIMILRKMRWCMCLQASSWSTWPVFYLNSGLRKLSAAHETSCTLHFHIKRKSILPPKS